MQSWTTIRRLFLIGAATLLLIHFSLLYFFIREQLALGDTLALRARLRSQLLHGRSHGEDGYRDQDEHSPLEANPDTDWGRDAGLLLLPQRRLHLDGRVQDAQEGPFRFRPRMRAAPSAYVTGPLGAPVERPGREESCLGVIPPHEDDEEPLAWQDVAPGLAAVFSAYLDNTPPDILPGVPGGVRNGSAQEKQARDEGGAWPGDGTAGDVGGARGRAGRLVVVGVAGPWVLEEDTFHCQVWYRTNLKRAIVVKATAVRLNNGSRDTESDVFFYCPVYPDRDPMAVSIINLKRCARSPPNLLLIRNIDEAQARTHAVHNFTVCLRPLRNRYNDIHALVETAELNLLLGAGRIVFYDQDTTDAVKGYYDSYKREDSATVIPWHLPPPAMSQSRMRRRSDFAVLSAFNDCLYRFRFTSRYIMFLDLEEFIIPEKTKSWGDLMSRLQSPEFSVFRFSRIPFPATKADEFDLSSETIKLLTQGNTKRFQPLPVGVKAGYMVKPTQIDIVSYHDVILRRKGWTLNVGLRDAGLRDFMYPDAVSDATAVEDKRTHLYKHALSRRVAERHALVRGRA